MARQQWWTLAKADMNETAVGNGHAITWKRLPRDPGCALVFEATCGDCGATVCIGELWSSCGTIRDARRTRCSGPGTAILTDIEAERDADVFSGLLDDYLTATGEIR
jgi:hypothetical protein